jgi:hypothetical protein
MVNSKPLIPNIAICATACPTFAISYAREADEKDKREPAVIREPDEDE